MIPKKTVFAHPYILRGRFDTVDYLAKKNIEFFETWIDEVDAVIIPEATCSAMIKQDWEHYFHNQPEWKRKSCKNYHQNIYNKMARK